MAQENREVYIAWLREKLEDYCNDDGSYEVYWDYDDSITPDQLVEAVDNWKSEGYTSPESYLASTLYGYSRGGSGEPAVRLHPRRPQRRAR